MKHCWLVLLVLVALAACKNKVNKQNEIAIDYESWNYVMNWQEQAVQKEGVWVPVKHGSLLTFFYNDKRQSRVLPRSGAYHYFSSVIPNLSHQAYFSASDSVLIYYTGDSFNQITDTIQSFQYRMYADTAIVLKVLPLSRQISIRFHAKDKKD